MKKLILIAIIIFISGCVSSVRTDVNNGLIVNSLTADPPVAEATDAVRFFLDAENVGGTTASCVTTELFGVDSWLNEFGQPISTFTPVFPTKGLGIFVDFRDGELNLLNFCYTDIKKGNLCVNYAKDVGINLGNFLGISFTQFSNQFCNNLYSTDSRLLLTKFQPELIPPNPALGRAGQSFTTEWILRPPVLPEGTSANYPITARTSYFYTTNAVMNVQALNKAEFKRRADLGQQIQYPLKVENSFGAPIQIFATRGDSPVVVNPESLSGPVEYHNYRFEFVNVGDGFPLPTKVDLPGLSLPQTQSGFIFATVAVDGPGVFFSDCLGQTGNEIYIGSNVIDSLVKLRSDQTVPIGCAIGIDRSRWATTPVGTITFTFNLFYRYYIDKTISVNVVGVEGLSGPGAIGSAGIPR